MITVEEFDKIDVRAGTVVDVKPNKKSRNPAYVMTSPSSPQPKQWKRLSSFRLGV